MPDDFNDDSSSDPEKIIKKEFKRIENSMHARMNNLMEQLTTFVTHVKNINERLEAVELTLTLNNTTLLINSADIKNIATEITALESYLALKDPILKKILDDNIKKLKSKQDDKQKPKRKRST